jgi:hypothetical protein
MKNLTMKAAFAAAIVLATSASAISHDDDDGQRLQGVWRMTRMGVNCQTGLQTGPSFQAIVTFNEDGTLSGYAVPPGSTPASGSPEFGVWKREHGKGNYSFNDVSYSYDAGGAFSGSTELTAKVQIEDDGKTLTQHAKIEFFDGNGALLFSACGKATGTRFR